MDAQKKLEIFKRILSLGSILGQMDEVDFLDQIWNLHLLNSDDPRYKDAYGDAVQYLRNNSDWDEECTFLTRFGLLKATDIGDKIKFKVGVSHSLWGVVNTESCRIVELLGGFSSEKRRAA